MASVRGKVWRSSLICVGNQFIYLHNFGALGNAKSVLLVDDNHPRFLKTTDLQSRWVPMSIWRFSRFEFFRAALFHRRTWLSGEQGNFTFMPFRNFETTVVVLCQDSVGAIKQLWNPLSRQQHGHEGATSVLPLPTSPCSSRFIWMFGSRRADFLHYLFLSVRQFKRKIVFVKRFEVIPHVFRT